MPAQVQYQQIQLLFLNNELVNIKNIIKINKCLKKNFCKVLSNISI